MIDYYIDPGGGFIFAQNASFLWGIILALLGTFLFFIFHFLKRFLWLILILLAILIAGGLMMPKPAQRKKVIVLGVDALDPNIAEKLMREGKLPNLSYLKEIGAYSRLQTTMPPESVVAWTSFSTGLNPGGHAIFDFIMRDPQTYLPYLSLNEILKVQGKVKIQTRRKGETFWQILSQNRVPSFIYFCPNTFPPDTLKGKMVSGMGVPDITGTMGRFSFYTTRLLTARDKDTRGRIIQIEPKDNIIETKIYGSKIAVGKAITESAVPLKIILLPNGNVSLEFQGNRFFLKEADWSNWQTIFFKIGPFKKLHGIVRFYLKSIKPEFELYASPVNFDPQRPPFPVSYPDNYAKKLAKKIGLYYTQGMPHDSWALTEDRLNEKAFLELTDEILNEKEKILKEGLKEFNEGVFFFYFDTLDMIQHMFWRYLDTQHPLSEKSPLYKNTIFEYYEKIDRIIGETLKNVDQDTTLIILSDHGFNSFRRAVHLNRWLLEKGYLFLKEGDNEGKELFENVDWSKTKAYALGFGGIYLNRVGREYYGIVRETEIANLRQEIIKGLKDWRDPHTQELVLNNVYTQDEIFAGPHKEEAPDLFVGFNAGYRCSWQTALGGAPDLLLEDNRSKWSGDHLIDSTFVPGVIFVNKRIDLRSPSIIDLAPTILGLFNVAKPEEMPGKVLFKNETN